MTEQYQLSTEDIKLATTFADSAILGEGSEPSRSAILVAEANLSCALGCLGIPEPETEYGLACESHFSEGKTDKRPDADLLTPAQIRSEIGKVQSRIAVLSQLTS